MADRKMQLRLKKFALDNLVRTSFGSDDDRYQEDQLNTVTAEIRDIYASYPDLLNKLNDDIVLVPSIDEIDDIQMANIGASATGCIQMISNGHLKIKDNEENIIPIILAYLEKVIAQAKENCRQMAEAKRTKEQIHQAVTERINEYFDDLHKKEDLFAQYVKKVESDSDNAAKSARISASKAAEASRKAKKAEAVLGAAIKSANDATNTACNAKNIARKAENTADNIVPNMLAVLGIFVGVIVAVVACYLSVILAGQVENSAIRTLPIIFMSYLVMGHIMLMTVFLLLYLISKLTSRSITNRCSRFDSVENPPEDAGCECDKCKKKCGTITRFGLLYTYVYVINAVFIFGYFVLAIWHIINKYYRAEFDSIAETYPWILLGIMSVCIAALVIRCLVVLCKKK